MKLFGKNRRGRPEHWTRPRKSDAPTKAEARLQKRIESYNASMRILDRIGKGLGPLASGYHRPGSLKAS